MPKAQGGKNRPLVRRAVEDGALDVWINAQSVSEYICKTYATNWGGPNSISVGVLLTELVHQGIVEKRGRPGIAYHYRKVDNMNGHLKKEEGK